MAPSVRFGGNIVLRLKTLFLPLALLVALTAWHRVAIAAEAAEQGGAFVKIVSIEDARKFETSPRDPSTPSLQDAAGIANKDLLARTVGRQRHMYGAAGRNIYLSSGETAAGFVRAAVAKALAAKGYTLVEKGAPHYAKALPLAIAFTQFWVWQTPGFFGKSAEFRTIVTVTGDVLAASPVTAEGYASDDTAHVRASHWRQIMQAGLDELSQKLAAAMHPPSAAAP